VSFNLPYIDEHYQQERRGTYVCRKYLRTWFFPDLLVSFPFELLWIKDLSLTEGLFILRYLKVFKVGCVLKHGRLLSSILKQKGVTGKTLRSI